MADGRVTTVPFHVGRDISPTLLRQVGKTTLALSLLGPTATGQHPAYFNWDDPRAAARASAP